MSIRSAAKAIVVHEGKVLLNKCHNQRIGGYFTLPGGGQHQHETFYEAIRRECLEETGYEVRPVRFAALYEEIRMDPDIRSDHPDYSHIVYHVFLCELASDAVHLPTEKDSSQISSEWIDVSVLADVRLLPAAIGKNMAGIIQGTIPPFLGSEQITFEGSDGACV